MPDPVVTANADIIYGLISRLIDCENCTGANGGLGRRCHARHPDINWWC